MSNASATADQFKKFLLIGYDRTIPKMCAEIQELSSKKSRRDIQTSVDLADHLAHLCRGAKEALELMHSKCDTKETVESPVLRKIAPNGANGSTLKEILADEVERFDIMLRDANQLKLTLGYKLANMEVDTAHKSYKHLDDARKKLKDTLKATKTKVS